MQSIKDFLIEWNKNSDSFAKVQGVYVVIVAACVVLAGFTALLNAPLASAIAFYALVAGLAFIGNGVILSITKTFIVPRIDARTPKPRKRPATKK